MLSTRGVSSFNDENTNNTRIVVCIYCILLYLIDGPPVFSILAEDTSGGLLTHLAAGIHGVGAVRRELVEEVACDYKGGITRDYPCLSC